MSEKPIPVVLFAFNRPQFLLTALDCLRNNEVPLIYAFSDGPRNSSEIRKVEEVRAILRSVNWCEICVVERGNNFGLGVSMRTGIAEVLKKHQAVIVFEDDLICVKGTYQYLEAALRHYSDDPRVMSVTGWTHPRVVPSGVTDQPYFDGRAEGWNPGIWNRAWEGMEHDAMAMVRQCKSRGIDINRCGYDLIGMAKRERKQNIWAVRLLYHHILKGGLCLRPPWSMVEHIGHGKEATNVKAEGDWESTNPPLKSCPPIPSDWPEPEEHPGCEGLRAAAYGTKPKSTLTLFGRTLRLGARTLRALKRGLG